MAHVQLAQAARAAGVPYGVTAHGMLDDWSMAQKTLKKRLYLALFGKRLLRGAAWLHCTAEGEAAQVRRLLPGLPPGKAVTAPLVVDLAPFADVPAPPPPSDLPRILFLSRLHPKKGLEKLIRACGELQRRGRPVALGVAGPGDPAYAASLIAMAQKEGVEAEFLGMVAGEEKKRVLRGADVFALPTSQENFGLALVEAMACGVPVITTRGVDIWPELQRAGAGILPLGATPKEWADALSAMLNDPGRAELGARGRAWVMENLEPQAVAAQYEALYAVRP
jgi:glycosyltransferase involved in cell wall biosynthesis